MIIFLKVKKFHLRYVMYMSLFYVYIISIGLGYFGLKGFQIVFYTNGGFYEKKGACCR